VAAGGVTGMADAEKAAAETVAAAARAEGKKVQ